MDNTKPPTVLYRKAHVTEISIPFNQSPFEGGRRSVKVTLLEHLGKSGPGTNYAKLESELDTWMLLRKETMDMIAEDIKNCFDTLPERDKPYPKNTDG